MIVSSLRLKGYKVCKMVEKNNKNRSDLNNLFYHSKKIQFIIFR